MSLKVSSAILAEIPGVQLGGTQREFFQFPIIGGQKLQGLPRGAIIEISGAPGAGKTELLLRFLAVNPQARIAWIEEEFTAYPCAFPQQGVSLDRVLFVQPQADSFWTLHQILKSQVFGIAVLSIAKACAGSAGVSAPKEKLRDPVVLRRMQIAAERAACSVILLTDQPSGVAHWPVSVQIQVSRDVRSGQPAFRVLRYRGGHPTGLAPSLEDSTTTSAVPGSPTTGDEAALVTEPAVQTTHASQEAR